MKPPKHPVTKKELVGGFDPLTVSQKPFGYRETRVTKDVFATEPYWFPIEPDPED